MDTLAETTLYDREGSRRGYELNRMAMSLRDPANRAAFAADEAAYLDRFRLSEAQRRAVLARDWREMIRLGGNLFYVLKISAIHPIPLTAIGAAQAGMSHDAFLAERLGKRPARPVGGQSHG
ncbi:MAG: hypothetical protein RLO50_19100 [Azospirillaceae bacterium]